MVIPSTPRNWNIGSRGTCEQSASAKGCTAGAVWLAAAESPGDPGEDPQPDPPRCAHEDDSGMPALTGRETPWPGRFAARRAGDGSAAIAAGPLVASF